MNNIVSLFHAFDFNGDKDNTAPLREIYFKMLQNSSGNYEKWHGVESFQSLL
jgi:hypothetical protein